MQLALNVSDLEQAVSFYSNLFRAEPSKRRPGYANFAIADPPLKLVLIQGEQPGGTLNHLGVEVQSSADVVAETTRLASAGMTTAVEQGVECCYAQQDKVWVRDPDGAPWEIYTVLADSDAPAVSAAAGASACCSPASGSACC